jgi:hypothetical protein
MSSEVREPRAWLVWAVGILGTFLIVAALVWAMRHYANTGPAQDDRAAVRAKALAELRAAEAEAVRTAAWIDQAKGIVRLPVTNAMQIVEREWQNPASARSNLLARVAKATAVPPAAPQKPSEFE